MKRAWKEKKNLRAISQFELMYRKAGQVGSPWGQSVETALEKTATFGNSEPHDDLSPKLFSLPDRPRRIQHGERRCSNIEEFPRVVVEYTDFPVIWKPHPYIARAYDRKLPFHILVSPLSPVTRFKHIGQHSANNLQNKRHLRRGQVFTPNMPHRSKIPKVLDPLLRKAASKQFL